MDDTGAGKVHDTANSTKNPTEMPSEPERMRVFLRSIQDTIARGAEIIRRSKQTISRIPDKW